MARFAQPETVLNKNAVANAAANARNKSPSGSDDGAGDAKMEDRDEAQDGSDGFLSSSSDEEDDS